MLNRDTAIGRGLHRSTKYSVRIDPATIRSMMLVSIIKPVDSFTGIAKPDKIFDRKVSKA